MRLLYIFLIAVLLSSCSPYGIINFKAKKPAEVYIPKEAKSVCFVIRQRVTPRMYDIMNLTQTASELNDPNSYIKDMCFEGFYDVLNNSDRFEQIMYYKTDLKVVEDSVDLKPLSWFEIGQISDKTESDIVVVLEKSSLKFSSNILWDYVFRCYDPYSFSVTNYTIFKDRDEGLDFQYSVQERFEQISYELGARYAKKIIPESLQIERLFYNKGNKTLRLGTYYLKQHEYDKAISLWKQLIDSTTDDELAYKLCINISLAEEIRNNYRESIKYASLSLHYVDRNNSKDKTFSIDLIKSLRVRLKEYNLLNR